MFETIKNWFSRSESILLARVTALVGFVTSAVAAMDWSPLVNLGISPGFTKMQVLYLGGVAIVQGIAMEIARRLRDPYLTISDAVAAEPVVAKAKKEVKKTVDKTPEV